MTGDNRNVARLKVSREEWLKNRIRRDGLPSQR